MRRLRWGLVAAVALISCVPEITVAPPEPGTVTVTVASATILQGATTQATANAVDSRGRPLTNEPRTWSTSAPLIATVSASGVVTGVAPGTANISASVLGRSGSVSVTITPAVASVTLAPTVDTTSYADTVRFVATPRDASGTPIPGRTVTWDIAAGAPLASVNTTGLVTPTIQNDTVTRTVTVRATADGIAGTASLLLTKVPVDTVVMSTNAVSRTSGATVQLTATPRSAAGNTLTQRPIVWATSNAAVATVNAAGLVTAVAAGTATVTATTEGKVGSTVVTVTNTPVASVDVVLPGQLDVPGFVLGTGRQQQVLAVLRDASGSVVTGRTVTWTSETPGIASVSATGLVSAVAISGGTNIRATSEGVTGQIGVTLGNPVNSIVAPGALTLSSVQTTSLAATVRDAANVTLTNRVVTATSSDTTIVSVDSLVLSSTGGVANLAVRGRSTGSASIIVRSEGRADTTAVTVNAPVVAFVTFEGIFNLSSNLTVGLNQTHQILATPRDASSNAIPGRTMTWTSSNPAAVTVSSLGVVTGVAAGSSLITATVDGVSATRTFATQNPVSSIVTSVTNDTLTEGQLLNVTVTPRDAALVTLSNRPFTVESSDTTVATAVVTGLNTIRITAVALGTATITVRSEGVSANISIRVAEPPVASVVLSSPSTSVMRGQTVQYTATLRDAANNVLTGRTVTWSSENSAIATVSSTGVVTGVGVGSTTIRATSEGIQGTRAITVTTDVNSVVVTPSTFTLNAAGATQQLTADPRNAANVSLTARTVTWSSLNTAVATVSASGLVTAVANGSTTIRATVEGVIGQATATVNITVNPCTPTAYTLGATINGQVTTSDCLFETNFWEDRFSFTRASSAYITFPVTPTGGSVDLITYTTQNSAGTSTPYFWTRFSSAGTATRLFGSGTFIFAVGNATTPPVNYSLSSSVATTVPPACQSLFTIIGSGINIGSSWDATSCLRLGKREGRFRVRLNAGQQITVGMSSTIDTYLELWATNADTVTTQVAFDDDTGGGPNGTNSLMTYTASSGGFFEIKATHFSSTAQTGTYTLTIGTSPISIMAPSLLSPDLNMGAPLMSPARHRGRQ